MYWQYMKFMVDGLHKTGKNAFWKHAYSKMEYICSLQLLYCNF
jgi:hypothetical protein